MILCTSDTHVAVLDIAEELMEIQRESICHPFSDWYTVCDVNWVHTDSDMVRYNIECIVESEDSILDWLSDEFDNTQPCDYANRCARLARRIRKLND